MKVTNNKIGATPGKVDTAKTAKTDAAKIGNVDAKATGGLKSKDVLKGSANVNVSERAQMMQKAKDIASADTIDEAKVARLQKLIDDGKYKVDADKIADRLVDEHLEIPD
jgi:flagellar biosynthesis anti-sigma factor FlgM